MDSFGVEFETNLHRRCLSRALMRSSTCSQDTVFTLPSSTSRARRSSSADNRVGTALSGLK
jgi:hypothetical protein